MTRLHIPIGPAALLAVVAGLAAPVPLQAHRHDTASVQANFLPKFPRYVAWPAARRLGPGAPFSLCVIGQDPFGRLLDTAAADEQIDGHGVTVRRLPDGNGTEGCHIAFVQGREPAETGRLLLSLRDQPILTVTASAGPQRGMIHLARVSGRMRFFINDAEAARHGLTISSRLLALAAGVTQRR